MTNKYDFRIRVAVTHWYDGDTFYGALDQGCGIFRAGGMRVNPETLQVELEQIRHRTALIQAPEMTKNGFFLQAGLDARAFAISLVPPGIYSCITYKADDNFDRPLVDLILPDGRLFSATMLAAGHAILYKN